MDLVTLSLLVRDYETACGANAKLVELLNEYEIVILPKPQGQ